MSGGPPAALTQRSPRQVRRARRRPELRTGVPRVGDEGGERGVRHQIGGPDDAREGKSRGEGETQPSE